MKIAVVIPVKNEENNINPLLDILLKQTRQPDEIIVVDGGSTDRTCVEVDNFAKHNSNIHLIRVQHALPGKGRNIGARSTSCEIIVFCDAGCFPLLNWIYEISQPFFLDQKIDVVYGSLEPLPKTVISKCIIATTYSAKLFPYVTCMALKKDVWEKVGGFPENLRTAEDLNFIKKIEHSTFKIKHVQGALNYWEPRESLRKFFEQYFTYAQGEGKENVLFLFHLRKLIFYIMLALLLFMTYGHGTIYLFAAIIFYFLWVALTVRAHFIWFKIIANDWRAYLLIPIIVFIRDIAAIAGYMLGQINRIACYSKKI